MNLCLDRFITANVAVFFVLPGLLIYIFSFLFFSMVLKVGQIGLSALFPSPACQCTPPNV